MSHRIELTRTIARYAVRSNFDRLPEPVAHESVRAFCNWMGVAIGGCREPAVVAAARYVAGKNSNGSSTLIGQNQHADPASAAFVNCISSSVLAFDDAHLPTVAHPSGPAAAALFALAQTRRISGPDFLGALALGIEIQCRIANMMVLPPGLMDTGFYVNGFSGPIGVAAAVGRLLRLDEQHMVWALGLAATQASGFRATHGTMTAHFRPGHATAVGVAAALLAEQGFDCTDDALEADGGFVDLFAPGSDLSIATDRLGEHHEMLENRYKPYPCGIILHPVIDACREARDGAAGRTISKAVLRVNPLVLRLTGKRLPKTPLEAHVSVYHWAALTLLGYWPGVAANGPTALADPEIRAFSETIEVIGDDEVSKGEAGVELGLADGSHFRIYVTSARGSKLRPMSDVDVDEKFSQLASSMMSTDKAAALLATCRAIAQSTDVGADVEALLP